jgi:hypothetical protein
MMGDFSLPPGFEDLLPLADWSLPRMDDRRDRRVGASMQDIDAFYNAMLPRMEAVLDHLANTPLVGMSEQSEALMNMALSMAEIAPAVEQFGEPTISLGYDVTRFSQGPQ